MLLNNQWVNKEIKGEVSKNLKTNENGKCNLPKSMGCSKSSSNTKFKAIEAYLKKTKSQINNLTLHLTELEKEEQAKPKGIIKKEITKSRNK